MKPQKLNKEALRPLTSIAKAPKAKKMIPMNVKTPGPMRKAGLMKKQATR